MSLPTPVERTPLHTRKITFQGYYREDGQWDIEAELTDAKAYPFTSPGLGTLPPETLIHNMAIRTTLDETLTIREISATMNGKPQTECALATHPMQQLVGCTMGPGWRATLEKHLGGIKGCTHLRELMFNMATAAFQTIPTHHELLRGQADEPVADAARPPYHLGKCMSWDFNGPLVKAHFPQYQGWQPLTRMK
ncbi:DUF2889 domain-containing protein [Variovorax sp. GT1P44]|uniref:DUF2889 domain-containing protein n=1 Tax=Variovorax sp. GT1P44 TaxID=3443742 RepID=UPI003F48345B